MIKKVLTIVFSLGLFGIASAQMPQHQALPGKTYAVLEPSAQNIRESDPNKVEVVGVFAYTCGHCYRVEEALTQWLKTKPESISFVRLPMPGSGPWELYAKTYFTLEAMDKTDVGHTPFFDAIIKQRKVFKKKEDIAAFMNNVGIDKEAFLKTWDTFAVKSNYERAKDVIFKQYKVDYTPIFIIDGKYMVDGTTAQAKSYEEIVEAVNKRALETLEEKKVNTNAP